MWPRGWCRSATEDSFASFKSSRASANQYSHTFPLIPSSYSSSKAIMFSPSRCLLFSLMHPETANGPKMSDVLWSSRMGNRNPSQSTCSSWPRSVALPKCRQAFCEVLNGSSFDSRVSSAIDVSVSVGILQWPFVPFFFHSHFPFFCYCSLSFG